MPPEMLMQLAQASQQQPQMPMAPPQPEGQMNPLMMMIIQALMAAQQGQVQPPVGGQDVPVPMTNLPPNDPTGGMANLAMMRSQGMI